MSLDDILKKLDADTKDRMKRKIPSWFADAAIPGTDQESRLQFPTALSTQQCSSESAARYKATVASYVLVGKVAGGSLWRTCPPPDTGRGRGPLNTSSRAARTKETMGGAGVNEVNGVPTEACLQPRGQIADLTGGLGVDSWAFSKRFTKVLYNEANTELAGAVKHNFEVLGCDNILISNKLLEPGNLHDILGDFKPDIIYLDPARRSATGKKVFLLEDCQPDVLVLKEELLNAAPLLLLKLSPMTDITMLLQRLGPEVTEVHVVAFDGECKELLVLLRRGSSGPATLTLCEDSHTLRFPDYYSQDGCGARVAIGQNFRPEGTISGLDDIAPGQILFEPGKALLKAGLFDYPCSIGYKKLAKHTHLYIAPDNYKVLPGKYFKIEKVLPLQSRTIKELSKQSLAAEVSCHNIPITSEDLRKRLRTTSSGVNHIFACHCASSDVLLFTTRL